MKNPNQKGNRGIFCKCLCRAIITVTLLVTGIAMADPPGSVEFTAAGFSVNENGGTAKVELIRNSLFGDPFTVEYATQDGSAQGNVDYVPTNGTIRFVPGQTNATITVRILDDSIFEGIETFTVALSNPTAGATIGPRGTTSVTILDDESVTPGRLDLQFDPGSGANDTVFTIHSQEDNSSLIGGRFTAFNGTARNGIARLNSDGSLDPAFAPAILNGETVYAIVQQPDGKIIIGGTFTSIGGINRSRIARLLPSGALDASFDPGTGADDVIRTVALQPDGRIIVGGLFTRFNEQVRYRLARLEANGTLDKSFAPAVDYNVTCSLVDTNGRIFIGGGFHMVNGLTRVYAARLTPDGLVDETFNPGGGNTVVNGTGIKTMALCPDGHVMIGSDASILYGSGHIALNRLLENGDLDRNFNPNVPAQSSVLAVAVQADGKVVIGGDFFRLADPTCCAMYDRKGIARLNRDGSVDTTFDVGSGVNPIYVTALELQSDLKILMGGAFTNYNGVARGRIARVAGDIRARIADWNYDGSMQLMVVNQPGQTYVVEASTNLTTWTPIATNTPTGSSFQFKDTSASTTGTRLYRVRQVTQ